MAYEIKMPQLSQTTDEVRLISWIVKEGEKVKKGDPLCQVETDKATMDVESFESGTVLKLFVSPDSIVNAGTVIAILGKPGERVKETFEAEEKKRDEEDIKRTLKHDSTGRHAKDKLIDEIKATSLVKNIARKKNIDLHNVKGTGPHGLITKKDLETHIKSHEKEGVIEEKIKEYPLSQNQISVARYVLRSKSEIPHFYLKSQVYADAIIKWRENNKQADGTKVSMYSLFIHAVAKTLRYFPKLNGYFKYDKIISYNGINIGFAVAAGDELWVPVIKNADMKNISEIDKEVKWLIAKAQNQKLEPKDLVGCTFTISNLGMYPVDEFYAIINPPQAGIVAIGGIKKTLCIDKNDAMRIMNVFAVTGSFDHRMVNGAQGAAFIEKFKKIIEEEM